MVNDDAGELVGEVFSLCEEGDGPPRGRRGGAVGLQVQDQRESNVGVDLVTPAAAPPMRQRGQVT